MPSNQTSLLTAVPGRSGQMLPGLRMPGTRAYRPMRAPEKPVRAAPATAGETKGARRAAPVAISPAASARAGTAWATTA